MDSSSLIYQSLADFKGYVHQRLEQYFQDAPSGEPPAEIPELDHPALGAHTLSPGESIILLCALAPHLQPDFYDVLIREFMPKGGEFAEFGGVKGSNTRYMLPTGDTALFLLAGMAMDGRAAFLPCFSTDHWFRKEKVLWLDGVHEGEPRFSGRLILSEDFVMMLTEGQLGRPAFGPDFPAKPVTTRQSWGDMVLPPATMDHLLDLHAWLRFNESVMKDAVLSRKIQPGYRALFFGPSGTGKTFAATLLGQEFRREVYRIDLSQIVSKYIGETEKNLEKVFRKAELRDWILFFDEADALFGKRSNVQSAHDKYANQEVSYLLQRIEDFPGVVILASNFKSNIDPAFLRRFNAIIEFPQPGSAERLELWKKALPATIPVDPGVDLKQLAEKYELTGSTISQVVHYAALRMYQRGEGAINTEMLIQGIQKELKKDNKLMK